MASSVLRPDTLTLKPWDLLLSLLLHGTVVLFLLLGRGCIEDDQPLFDPDEIMQVQMVALPKARGRNPDRATRAPSPPPPAPVPEAAMPSPEPFAEPHPSNSETRPEEPPPKADSRDRRADVLRQLRRSELIKDIQAPLGDVDRSATDPNSTLSPEEAFAGLGTGAPMDPDLARYQSQIRRIVLPNWTPLPRIIQDNPDLFTIVEVTLDADGKIEKTRMARPSGNTSYDESCIRAVQKSGRLPLPPPKFQNLASRGIWIHFPASDAR